MCSAAVVPARAWKWAKSLSLKYVAVEAAVDGRAVLRRPLTAGLAVVGKARKQRAGNAAGQDRLLAGGAEDDAGAGPSRAHDLSPQRVQLRVRHPVLRVEQHVGVERGGRQAAKMLGEGGVHDRDVADARAQNIEALALQVGRERGCTPARVAAAEGLPGEVV